MTARVVQLIVSDDLRRGRGTDEDPIRAVPCLYTLDGRLVIECDPVIDPHHRDDGNELRRLAAGV